ncbi:hypothetical protein JD844_021947 [Phrynosoma platyrhinos]|uniref:VWFD domain-containing protein n=1 Tax=Phrynosoma platyrhinos TaxID=52577 RepID=A0ABQ7SUK9_PHRPL|nr:hypothetical protein JD844_021947 [Phrynosoma platyrhinos]
MGLRLTSLLILWLAVCYANQVKQGRNPNHSQYVCSTWGNNHFKTFDGDFYQFPGVCEYNFVSDCRESYKEFSVHIQRELNDQGHPGIQYVLITVKDIAIYLTQTLVVVNGQIWETEGLTYNPITFGNLQKIHNPKAECEDPDETKTVQLCRKHRDECVKLLTSKAFEDCQSRLNLEQYIQACMQDRCACQKTEDSFCLCSTISEFSRQCSHAGGKPQNWRTPQLCPKSCPGNMVYLESGSPCMDTCSHLDISRLCEEHYVDGCFCPEGTVYDDITGKGCVPTRKCHCKSQGNVFSPGQNITNECESCVCKSGRWVCQDLPCPSTCALEGGAHITTFDGKKYTFHGDCYYVLTKSSKNDSHVLLAELGPCSSIDKQTCLKTVALLIDHKQNVVVFKSDGTVLLNEMEIHLPHVAGLCGNFNGIESDDFKTSGGLVEATGTSFANTWKAQASCTDKVDSWENPCTLSVENENYAEHWCSLLKSTESAFARCHSVIDPTDYYKRCKYDTCNCNSHEECLCAALSSYARACAAKGVMLWGWRDNICNNEVSSCPATQVFRYNMNTCQQTCRSLSEGDKQCMQGFTPVDGCGCPDNTYLNEKDNCVPISKCPCYYNGKYVQAGEAVMKQEARCTCQKGSWRCTTNVCYGTCIIYGSGHYITFDGKNYDFDGNCEYVAAQNTELKLEDKEIENINLNASGKMTPWFSQRVGLYIVIEIGNGIMLVWDQKTTIFIKLAPHYKGKVCGLCGNFDDKAGNDFTTRSMVQENSPLTFGNSWKRDSTCPDVETVIQPCEEKPHRKAWAEKECSLIKSSVFVDPEPYYEACVHDACACDTGGDCECFCTAVAAYAQECTKADACVNWRTPEICPIYCDFYNPSPEVCEWHYEPCGRDLLTCELPNNIGNITVPPVEGCYPRCPPEFPFYDHGTSTCVAEDLCSCYYEGVYYRPGQLIPNYESRELCQECLYYNHYIWNTDEPGGGDYETYDAIRNKEKTSICSAPLAIEDIRCRAKNAPDQSLAELGQKVECNVTYGLICRNEDQDKTLWNLCYNYEISVYCCSPDSICVDYCEWSQWIDVSYPKYGSEYGDYETYDNIRAHNISICERPENISCRAVKFPASCVPSELCEWSQWIDVSYPKAGSEYGDYETYENIRAHNISICERPENISCRAVEFPGYSWKDLGQIVECDVTTGLTCNNKDQSHHYTNYHSYYYANYHSYHYVNITYYYANNHFYYYYSSNYLHFTNRNTNYHSYYYFNYHSYYYLHLTYNYINYYFYNNIYNNHFYYYQNTIYFHPNYFSNYNFR